MKIITFLKIWIIGSIVFSSVQVVAQQSMSISDKTIQASIYKKISESDAIPLEDISVESRDGVVKISGSLDSTNQIEQLVEITQSTPNVKVLDTSMLTIRKSNQSITDIIITAKIKGLLIRNQLFGDKSIPVMSINVDTKNGIVYLTGRAFSREQVANAKMIAKSISGVKAVKSNIKIVNH